MKLLKICVAVAVIGLSCQSNSNSQVPAAEVKNQTDDDQALRMMKPSCYACHNPNAPSHDAIIAPPLAAVKYRYQMRYKSKEAFVSGMTAFMKWPSSESSLMPGAVARFGVMATTTLPDDELKAIAAYIYDHDVEKPVWFDEHFENQHGTGNQ